MASGARILKLFKSLTTAHDNWMTADWLPSKIGKFDRVTGITLLNVPCDTPIICWSKISKGRVHMFQLKMKMAVIGCCAVLMPAHSSFAVEGSLGKVKACSDVMAANCATGTVRNTAYGKQVQLPGGT